MGRDINKELAEFNRSPALEDVIWEAIHKRLVSVHVAIPAIVKKYDKARQLADVELQYPDFDNSADPITKKYRKYPKFLNCPVFHTRSRDFFVHIDLEVGSYVMVFFADRNLSEFRKGRDPADYPPGTGPVGEKNGIMGAFALPIGAAPTSDAIDHAESSGITIGSDDANGMRIHVEKEKITVTTGTGSNLELSGRDATALLKLGDGAFSALIAEKVQVMWTAMAAMFAAHTHQTPAGPTSTPSGVVPPWDPTANSQSTKIPK